MLSLP